MACYYKNGGHDDAIAMAGATTTNTRYRCIRSAETTDTPAETTPFIGTIATGAFLKKTADAGGIVILENYSRAEKISVSLNFSSTNSRECFSASQTGNKFVFCIAANSTNSGTGTNQGFRNTGVSGLFYGCIAYGMSDSYGFKMETGAGESAAAVCCTAVGNGTYGFEGLTTGTAMVFSCYAANNTTADFRDTATYWVDPTSWNASKDATADLGGEAATYYNSLDYITGGQLDANYLATVSLDADAGAGAQCGKNPVDELSASFDLNSFFTGPDALFGYDIAGKTRPAGTDVAWDVGASEYVAAGGALSILVSENIVF